MSPTYAIDTDVAAQTAQRLIDDGGRLDLISRQIRADMVGLSLTSAADSHLAQAAQHYLETGEYLKAIADRAIEADLHDQTISVLQAHYAGYLESIGVPSVPGTGVGDLGGTFTTVARPAWVITGTTGLERGREVVMQALAHAADRGVIENDEFEIVEVGADRYVVVLPGVIDLSKLHVGFDEYSRSSRDLDQGAIRSASSSSVDKNLYAQYVAEAIRQHVPPGSHLALIGHSYGADTAVDLAADDRFTERYDITHVVAAGYATQRTVPDVDPAIEVLAINNNKDSAAVLETMLRGPIQHLNGNIEVLSGAVELDPGKVWDGVWNMNTGWSRLLLDDAGFVVDNTIDIAKAPFQLIPDRYRLSFLDFSPADLGPLEPGVSSDGNHTTVVFEGEFDGYGHAPLNYLDYLANTDEAEIARFMTSLHDAGYTNGGTARAVDLSVPEPEQSGSG